MVSDQARWAMKEFLKYLSLVMKDDLEEDKRYRYFKELAGWMVMARDDTMLPTFLHASQEVCPTFSKSYQMLCAERLVAVVKSYKYHECCLDLLYLAKALRNEEEVVEEEQCEIQN